MWGGERKRTYNAVVTRGTVGVRASMARTSVLAFMVTKSGTSSGSASVVRTSVGASAIVGNLSIRTSGGRNRRGITRFVSTMLNHKLKSINMLPDRTRYQLTP